MKHILLAVTGMSPAVITETLWALRQQAGKVWPEEVHIITTLKGRQAMLEGTPAALEALVKEWKTPPLKFNPDFVYVVPDAEGHAVDDALTKEDQEALGDFIVSKVAALTSNDNLTIHASIAGGRKTMTYYLGYAMSLFGRPRDELSHVLVTDPRVEGNPAFFYPAFESRILPKRNASDPDIDAKNVDVILVDIPFVRQREIMPSKTLELLNQSKMRFRDMVNLINLGNARERIQLTFRDAGCQVIVSDRLGTIRATVTLVPMRYAFYKLMAEATREDGPIVERPQTDKKNADNALGMDKRLTRLLIEKLVACYTANDLPVKYDRSATLEENIGHIRYVAENHMNLKLLQNLGINERFTKTLDKLAPGLGHNMFDSLRNYVESDLKNELPENLTKAIAPCQIFDSEGERITFSADRRTSKTVKAVGYGLDLEVSQIVFLD